MKSKIVENADLEHETAEEWYGAYGAHISTEHHGDLKHDVVEYDWLDGDDSVIVERLQEMYDELSDDEADSLVALARGIREAAESVVSNLEAAVEAYERRDIAAVIDALEAASLVERDHGDDPASRQLRMQLLLAE